MGNPVLKTPNIDTIANNGGVRFTNYFCANPICMPNRASFFTGAYPSEHKTRSNGINLNPELPTITGILSSLGYHTCSVGKLHFQHMAPTFNRFRKFESSLESIFDWLHGHIKLPFPTPYYGFQEVYLATGHGDLMAGHYSEWLKEQGYDMDDYLSNPTRVNNFYHETKLPEELYPTSYIADETVEYLKRTANGEYGNKAFFLHCSFPDPHQSVCPPGKYKDMYNPEDIDLPSNFDDGQKLLEHEFLGKYIKQGFEPVLPSLVSEEVAKKFTAMTYGSIAMIDDGVGKILNYLEESGLAENTMVIFTSDHGDFCGDHGLIVKGPAHYRSVINPPLLWTVPGLTKSSVSNSLVSTVDLPKTILSLLRIEKKHRPEMCQGYDISSILENPSNKIREQLLIEHDEELTHIRRKEAFRLRTLITERHRLTIYDGFEKGDIFDYESDPTEVNNLWNKDENLKNILMEKLMREMINLQLRIPSRKSSH
jgi:arylsulfatase A-like enzyme